MLGNKRRIMLGDRRRISDPEIPLSESSIILYPMSINSLKGELGARSQTSERDQETSAYLELLCMCVQI